METHLNCYCVYVPMRTKRAGTATNMGMGGADVALVYSGELPDYYVTKQEAQKAGWCSKKENLGEVLPGQMIGENIYLNKSKKLPDAPERI